ncbi:hypothetical protein AB833_05840 [Chromatiales bacterium (ex Bugula neritina AB1)]|nr:hypothetical protein AB833_05840 [Chromatiales bacterium (ex Bugula neritina AB1)]
MAQLAHCRHWIFDMDGTLTIAAHDFDQIRRQLGIEGNRPILEAISKMPEEQALATTARLHQLEMDIAADSRAQTSAVEVLTALKNRDYSLGIVTRNAKDIAHETLTAAGLSGFFSDNEIIGREDCAPKPDPAGLHLLMTLWNAGNTETAMIGDYVFDLEAGRNASVTTVHFDTQAHYPWPELTDVKINQLEQLLTLL